MKLEYSVNWDHYLTQEVVDEMVCNIVHMIIDFIMYLLSMPHRE